MFPARALLCCLLAAWAGGADDGFARDRSLLRQQRQQFAEGAAADRAQRAAKAATAIGELIDAAARARGPGQDAALTSLVAALARLDAERAAALAARVAALPVAPEKAEAQAARAWERALAAKREAAVAPSRALLAKAMAAGALATAADAARDCLAFAPDDAALRARLGQTRWRDGWCGQRNLAARRQGFAWDHEFGWVPEAGRERYARGECFDLQAGAWTTLAAADASHASLEQAWRIDTEHLELHGNARLHDLVDAAQRLEAFYAVACATWAPALAPTARDADLRTALGCGDHPRLVVNLERTAEDYRRALPIAAGWSDGMFVFGATPASYFYVDGRHSLYHEFTHQLLWVLAGGSSAPAWLIEGVAVYAEAPVEADGAPVIGRLEANGTVREFIAASRAAHALTLAQLTAVTSVEAWSQLADSRPAYAAAGALVHYCMEGAGRRYRGDFLDYLRDAYRGATRGHDLCDYLGIAPAKLEEELRAWAASDGAR